MAKIYTDLDSILDTRVGAMLSVSSNPNLLLKSLIKGGYLTRIQDNFKSFSPIVTLDSVAIRELQNKGDKKTLTGSIMTNIALMIRQLVNVNEQRNETLPDVENLEVDINVNEYKLSSLERREMEQTLNEILKCKVNLIKIPLDFLNLNYVKNEYDVMFMYYFNDWLNVIEEQLTNGGNAMGLNVIAPAIYFNGLPDETQLKELDGVNSFRATELIFSNVFKLDLIDAKNFSFYVPET